MKQLFFTICILLQVQILLAQAIPNLVAYWPMNGNFNDAGPYAINGTNVAATNGQDRGNIANNAMQFTNPTSTVAQYATHPINSNVNFSGTQNFTIDFWAYFNSPFVSNGGIYDNMLNSNGYGVWFWNTGGFKIQFNYKNGSVGSAVITLGSWYHVTCVRNAGTLSIYLNGSLSASAAEGTGTPSYTFPARFGTMFYSSFAPPQYNGFNGRIDELRIYNRALTIAEIGILQILPIKLTNFSATVNNNNAILNWQTANELNAKHFIVQRSFDGISFNDIATVKATGNTLSNRDYTYTDATAKLLTANAVFYYRLKSVDNDEKFVYSNILSVKLKSVDAETVNILSNPVNFEAAFQINALQNTEVRINIYNSAGVAYQQKILAVKKGYNNISVNVENLSSGLYFAEVILNGKKQTIKFVKN